MRTLDHPPDEQPSRAPMHPSGRCGDAGPCDDCIDFIWAPGNEKLKAEYARREYAAAERKAAAATIVRRRVGRPTVLTVERLMNHARLFGPDGVLETGRAHLVEAEIAELEAQLLVITSSNGKRVGGRQRRTTDSLRGQVLALRDRGLVAAAIADVLNVSDRRVAEILSKSRTPSATPDFPLNQARLFAA